MIQANQEVDGDIPGSPGENPDVTVVLIVSTLCNLRCRYCYEYPELANRHRISELELELLFSRLARHYAARAPIHIRFAWQGGEPLLHEPEYYRRALQRQAKIFRSSPHRLSNVLQTNLTVLDEARIELLRECFDGVGVSHDVIGDLRVDAGGRPRTQTVEANLDRLIEAQVRIGGITVLSQQNVAEIAQIYRFWQARRLPFRLLPMHRGPLPTLGTMALSPSAVQRAFAECFDLWLSDPGDPRPIAPLGELVAAVLRARSAGSRLARYDRPRQAALLIINPRGFVGGVNDLLELGSAYGNLLDSSLEEILAGQAFAQRAAQSEANVRQTCSRCPYFRVACDGQPAAEGGKEFWQRDASGAPLCSIQRGTLAHIERRLTEVGLLGPAEAAAAPHPEVAPA
ncbi:MAG TPA: radical SAM protein [Polyangiaceae bacterium]|jgi:uncharacterized protein|nr:radical SAM protein [Polyangiaceae bacterium]